jgi:hypothetical protein
MLAGTRFARWFDVVGSRSTHFGVYPCGPTMAAAQYGSTRKEAVGVCC